jgi:uncharacterized protein (DUF433 family)
MAQQAPRIAEELLDEPHIDGRRVSVGQIHDRVKQFGKDPEAVADEFDLDIADVYHALAYYYGHQDELEAVRKRRERELDEIREEVAERRPDGVSP